MITSDEFMPGVMCTSDKISNQTRKRSSLSTVSSANIGMSMHTLLSFEAKDTFSAVVRKSSPAAIVIQRKNVDTLLRLHNVWLLCYKFRYK